jgi:hypothetical protein
MNKIIDTYYWISEKESTHSKDFIIKAYKELSVYLKRQFELDYSFKELPEKFISDIHSILNKNKEFNVLSADISDYFLDKFQDRVANLVVFCNSESNLCKKALEMNPHALWGCACGRLAAVYKANDMCPIWHETLHLFGAIDCYDDDSPNSINCENQNCLMQYASVTETLELCNYNITLLAERFNVK